MAKGNPYGHSDSCCCERCQDWEDVQLGISALGQLKAMKAKIASESTLVGCEFCGGSYTASATKCPNCGGARKASQTPTPSITGPTRIVINGRVQCLRCGEMVPANVRFCPFCGKSQS